MIQPLAAADPAEPGPQSQAVGRKSMKEKRHAWTLEL